MRDLVRISDAELQELTSGQRLRMLGAFSIAMACGIVALHGMLTLFTDAPVVPLPGMKQPFGQIAWAAGLVAMLAAVTLLVRGMIKRRLQWAIALSLGLHFVLCASMSVVEFRGPQPIPDQTAEFPGATPEEFTLPDYAGTEKDSSDVLWKRPMDSVTPEDAVDVPRTELEIAEADKPEPVKNQPTQEVEKLESIEQQAIRNEANLEPENVQAEMTAKSNVDPDVADAESVEVASASSIDAPQITESVAASSSTRGVAAIVPAGSAEEKSFEAASASTFSERISTAPTERIATEKNLPVISSADGSPLMTERGESRLAEAAGTVAGEVSVATAGENSTNNGDALVAGPASTNTGRMRNGFPSRENSAEPNGSLSTPGSIADGLTGLGRSSAAAVVGSRPEPNARLSDNHELSGGSNESLPMARSSSANVGLPAGAAEAEESGTLIFAGPQAAETGGLLAGNRLTGPRTGTLPRRSAGLPGSRGPAVAAGGTLAANQVPSSRVALTRPGSANGDAKPKLAAIDTIAGMIRKSLPGIGASAEARIAESLSMRTSNARREAANLLGGSAESEDAVERGLVWLAKNQYPDGHWSIDDFPGESSADTAQGTFRADSAATGLALLAYLGAGYTHQSGQYQDVVNRGVQRLLKRQKSDGDLFAEESDYVQFYSHGMAAIALCEAYGMTKDGALKTPAQNALNFIVASQHPEFGGWRYRARFESDTSVSGWQLMALKSGEMSGLKVPKDTYVRIAKWLDSVQSKSAAGQYSYHPTREASPSMTAEALLMRQYLGARRDDAQLVAGADYLRTRLPDFGQRDSYYWYYATQVMFHMQGDHWTAWNESLRDTLVETQSKDGPASGSWDPINPTPEKWSKAGGRHYLTTLNLLMLEVYYRHLPLYLELAK